MESEPPRTGGKGHLFLSSGTHEVSQWLFRQATVSIVMLVDDGRDRAMAEVQVLERCSREIKLPEMDEEGARIWIASALNP